jgi:hypothetical protein
VSTDEDRKADLARAYGASELKIARMIGRYPPGGAWTLAPLSVIRERRSLLHVH